MSLPEATTPLYNHPLPEIEQWLIDLGCAKDREQPHCWSVERSSWKADICLEIEEISVCYLRASEDGADINRSFRYSLSRKDVEAAIFSGP